MVSVYYETQINQYVIPESDSSVAEGSGQVFDALSLGEQFPLFIWSFVNHMYINAEMHPRRPVSSVIITDIFCHVFYIKLALLYNVHNFSVTVNDYIILCVLS